MNNTNPKPPEQMTPEEYSRPKINALIASIAEREKSSDRHDDGIRYGSWQAMISYEKTVLGGLLENLTPEGRGKEWSPQLQQRHIFEALEINFPVSVIAIDTYGIELPEGYVKRGELYHYNDAREK